MPVPLTNGRLNVSGNGMMHITVSNLLGQKIMEVNAEGPATLDMSQLVPGVYTIKVDGLTVRFVKK